MTLADKAAPDKTPLDLNNPCGSLPTQDIP